jgi:hypothetical protein
MTAEQRELLARIEESSHSVGSLGKRIKVREL